MHHFLKISSQSLGLNLTDQQVTKLLNYLDLLCQWNKVYNLCASASYKKMISHHLLDSISVASGVQCKLKKILDVGSGAGLPGIPLAIVEPSCNMVLLECKSKKVSFLRHAVNALNLKNVVVELSRAENYRKSELDLFLNKYNEHNYAEHSGFFDLIVSRAVVSDLAKFVQLTERFCDNTTILVAMKSDPDAFKIGASIAAGYKIIDLKIFDIPGVSNKRCLVIIGNYNVE